MGVFQKLNDQGMTIVMVTHELDIAQYTKRMVVMRDGKVVERHSGRQTLDRRRPNCAGCKQEQKAVRSMMQMNDEG